MVKQPGPVEFKCLQQKKAAWPMMAAIGVYPMPVKDAGYAEVSKVYTPWIEAHQLAYKILESSDFKADTWSSDHAGTSTVKAKC